MSLERFSDIETATIEEVFEERVIIPLEGPNRSSVRMGPSLKVRIVGYHTWELLIVIYYIFRRFLNAEKWDVSLGHLGEDVYIQGQGECFIIRERGGFGRIDVSSTGSDLDQNIWHDLENFAEDETSDGFYDTARIQRIAGKLNRV